MNFNKLYLLVYPDIRKYSFKRQSFFKTANNVHNIKYKIISLIRCDIAPECRESERYKHDSDYDDEYRRHKKRSFLKDILINLQLSEGYAIVKKVKSAFCNNIIVWIRFPAAGDSRKPRGSINKRC